MLAIIRSKQLVIAFLICLLVIQFPYSRQSCNPSSCGSIHNISYPFRLNTDPQNCGNPDYELTCEQNRAVLTLESQKYYVQSINYNNFTIRVVDPGVQHNNICSFPRYALARYNFSYSHSYPYGIATPDKTPYGWQDSTLITVPIIFLRCPFPVKSSAFVETSRECWNKSSTKDSSGAGGYAYAYAKLGSLNASDLRISCRVELITMTSSLRIQENKNVSRSLLEIYDALMYGFELSWFPAICQQHCGSTGCYLDFTNEISCYGYFYGILQNIWFCLQAVGIYEAIISAPKIIIGVPCALVFLIIKFRRRHLSVFEPIESFLSADNNLLPISYSYKHIKNMTKALKEKLGEGGFGSVYKGKLRSGRDVAVKIISKPNSNGQDFINEVASMGRIHHVNIVRLVGYCAQNSKRALVYDFMSNGSLDKYINEGADASLLNWQRKFEIAVGVARGIDYLHRGCDIQILHFDIKPHNILLDENIIPKISDFGLAKLFPTDKTVVTLTAARGTIGYVAPELINRSIGAISHKADVYSFGMLLMEMLGLKKTPVTEQDESSKYFPSWIYNDINKGKAIEMGEEDEDEKRITKKMTIVGLWCIQTSPIPRPSMRSVVEMLEGDVELLQMPTDTFFSEPIMEVDQEHSSMPESSESIAFLPNSASSNNIGIIVD
ncbi:PREDICTED: LEAF RUST 10 DISEASE-RESISTANCE LOCUS RECEPTOR-LIKE PROTEIN KINASE-like 2.1 isoform X2 [Ipomoea nil]|uniref:LEAF RUST 10 DISEASE-RESISTANCE LOCUS RECEPTOR-LIKE PROTEIN KINASE-like 2.1 isoform X2 n=1 Tax=Ipomoea nil TaxID=35883 RepID=UPI000901DB23|nr:PREDICTED: LEAF RUST 10 DISEASE-RESISTANCE LOCUS RECEPTOR-LIKE PROTEIN KINASE-like 2.1 isoform X2 [Ipomoea nil]